MKPGDRVIAGGYTGTLVEVPVVLPEGYCTIKFDHVPNITDTYAGTMVAIAEVEVITPKLVQLPLFAEIA